MPDDKKRYDIDLDFNGPAADLLKDVEAASNAVKQRRTDDKVQEARTVQRSNSKKTSAVLISVGAVVVLLLSYWIVFAKPQCDVTGPGGSTSAQCQPAQPTKIAIPLPTKSSAHTPQSSVPTGAVGRDSQVVVHPPDGYEQPNEEPGM